MEKGNQIVQHSLSFAYDYEFSEIEPYVVGEITPTDWFSFIIYSNHAPSEKDKILINGTIYIVESVVDEENDDTDDSGFWLQSSYSKVWLCKLES